MWDGQNIVLDLNGDYSAKMSFVRGIRLVSYKNAAGERSVYNFNVHGDVLGITKDTSGAPARYQYDAFGNQIGDEASENPFRYCGEYTDAETGLIYLRARYYDPATGQFTTQDPHWNVNNMICGDNPDEDFPEPDIFAINQNSNLYIYAMNNPIKFMDISGFKAGDKYNSADEAATAWAYEYYGTTEYLQREQVSAIYMYWENGKLLYSYTEPVVAGKTVGSVGDACARLPLDIDYVMLGIIHSHAYGQKFSNADKKTAKDNYWSMYVVTPSKNGTVDVKKYSDTRNGWSERTIKSNLKYKPLSQKRKMSLRKNIEGNLGNRIGDDNMKKKALFCAIIILIIMSGCENDAKDKGVFQGVINDGTTIQDVFTTPGRPLVIDQYLALKIGDAVLTATYGEEALKGLIYDVSEIKGENWFWVCRRPDMDVVGTVLDGGYNVAIDKQTGKILKIWRDDAL